MLVDEVKALIAAEPMAADVLALPDFDDFPGLAGAIFCHICGPRIGQIVEDVYRQTPLIADQTQRDISETARRNFEPGGPAAVVLFARGVHATMGHRVANALWQNGQVTGAMTLKAAFGRAFATDIHPAARIGGGFWLDHGLGFVAGETAQIGEDVSIWHNVTLGSTFNDAGADRHPKIGDGVVIGAGAMVLGGITVGAAANIAAGAVVLEDVPSGRVFIGNKARDVGPARVSFAPRDRTP
jgi:serine O-acetyltransferase